MIDQVGIWEETKMKVILKVLLIFSNFIYMQTSDQKKQAIEMIKSSGMSQQQAKELARQRGFTDRQIEQAIEQEISKEQINNTDNNIPNELNIINELEGQINKDSFESNQNGVEIMDDTDLGEESQESDEGLDIEKSTQSQNVALSYFGYDIFENDPAIFQSTSVGAVDPSYLIGPDDEIIVMLWGETEFRQVLRVDREGFIFIPDVGQVFVNGLNLKLLESKLFRVLSQSYSSLDPRSGNATTFLDISLGNLRPLRIHVIGEVSQPGAYTVSPSATLFSALYYFNGPTTSGSLRDIRLIRNGKLHSTIDFYDYLMTGKKPRDTKLQLDDVIFIPQRKKTVSIQGEVNRPGIFELKETEEFNDMLYMSGGLKVTAYLEMAQIDRIVPFSERETLGMDRQMKDIKLREIINSKTSFELREQDRIKIFSIQDMRQNIVTINGAVSRPGNYEIGSYLSLKELIIKADSLLGDAYMERADIVRVNPDLSETLIKVNLFDVVDGDNNIQLQGLDRVTIYSTTEMIQNTFVYISGAVLRPGQYRLQEGMSLYDLIFKGGGFIDNEFKKNVYTKRAELIRQSDIDKTKAITPFNLEEVLNRSDPLADLLLKPNDNVRIYRADDIEGGSKTVTIRGNVKFPGTYELYEKNMTIYDLLFKAAGFEDMAFKKSIFYERADLLRYDDNFLHKSIYSFNLKSLLKNPESKENKFLQDGDLIIVYPKSIFNTEKSLSISGVIKTPGAYTFKEDMDMKDLLLEAGGLSDDIYRYRLEVARIDPNISSEDEYAKITVIDMDRNYSIIQVENQDGEIHKDIENFKLAPYDKVYVRSDPNFSFQKVVRIDGAVNYPGEYTLLTPTDNLYDLINRAGGLKKNAYLHGSSFNRSGSTIKVDIEKIIKRKGKKENFILKQGDAIFISEKPNIIQINGEVNAPGLYKYQKNEKVNDVIKRAGGFTLNAEKKNVYITYPNGRTRACGNFFANPKVTDGSIINVGAMPEEEPFDATEYAKEISSILADFAQVVSILYIASRR